MKNQHGWYKAEEKMQYVQGFLESKQSLKKYALDNSIKESTLRQWIRIYDASQNQFQDITPILKPSSVPDTISNTQENSISNRIIKMNINSSIVLEFDVSLLKSVLGELK